MAKTATPTGEGKTLLKRENNIMGLTWPIFVELLLQMLVGNADQIMVGWSDPNGVGAIGNANQVTNLLILVFSVICTASMILISQYIGAKDTRSLGQTYAVSLVTNLIFGMVVSVALIFGCEPIFRLMGVHEDILADTCLYMRIIGGGMVFQAVYLTFTAFFRSNQMMKETMIVSVVMNCLNIGGNAVLINGLFGLPALGVAGAAVSSDISRFVGVVIIAIIFRKKFRGAVKWSDLKPFPVHQLRRLLRIGVPTGSESMSYNLSQIGIQTVCNRFAPFVVNTRVYASMFANITFIFGSAISQAGQVVVARLMGAANIEETDKRVKYTLVVSLVISGVVSVVLWLLCEPLYSIFTKDTQIITLAKTIMLIEIPLELGRAVNMVMCRALQACGDIKFPTTICVISAWLVAVGGSVLFGGVLGFGLAGLWAAMAVDECLRALLFLWRWKSRSWAHKSLLAS